MLIAVSKSLFPLKCMNACVSVWVEGLKADGSWNWVIHYYLCVYSTNVQMENTTL